MVKVRQVVREELSPERERCPLDHEDDDKQVAQNAREVTRDISLEHCTDNVGSQHSRSIAGFWSVREFII